MVRWQRHSLHRRSQRIQCYFSAGHIARHPPHASVLISKLATSSTVSVVAILRRAHPVRVGSISYRGTIPRLSARHVCLASDVADRCQIPRARRQPWGLRQPPLLAAPSLLNPPAPSAKLKPRVSNEPSRVCRRFHACSQSPCWPVIIILLSHNIFASSHSSAIPANFDLACCCMALRLCLRLVSFHSPNCPRDPRPLRQTAHTLQRLQTLHHWSR